MSQPLFILLGIFSSLYFFIYLHQYDFSIFHNLYILYYPVLYIQLSSFLTFNIHFYQLIIIFTFFHIIYTFFSLNLIKLIFYDNFISQSISFISIFKLIYIFSLPFFYNSHFHKYVFDFIIAFFGILLIYLFTSSYTNINNIVFISMYNNINPYALISKFFRYKFHLLVSLILYSISYFIYLLTFFFNNQPIPPSFLLHFIIILPIFILYNLYLINQLI